MPDVDDHRAAGPQPVARELEELLGRQVERDVRLAVGVEEDRVVALLGGRRRNGRASSVCSRSCGRVLQAEVAAPDVEQLAVDLDRVDHACPGSSARRRGRPCPPAVPSIATCGGRPRRDGQRLDEEAVPVAAGQHGARPVERVDRLPSLSSSVTRRRSGTRPRARTGTSVSASSITRPVARSPSSCPTGTAISAAIAERDERATRGRRPSAADRGGDQRERQERALGARPAGSAAARRANVPSSEPTVEIAYMRPATSPESSTECIFSRSRPRRDRAEHQHRHGDQHQHAEQRAGERPDRDVVERAPR